MEKEERIRQITGLGSFLLFPKYIRLLLNPPPKKKPRLQKGFDITVTVQHTLQSWLRIYIWMTLWTLQGFENIISNYFIGYLDSKETDEKAELWILIYDLYLCIYIMQYKYKYFLFRFQAGDVWYNVQV